MGSHDGEMGNDPNDPNDLVHNLICERFINLNFSSQAKDIDNSSVCVGIVMFSFTGCTKFEFTIDKTQKVLILKKMAEVHN